MYIYVLYTYAQSYVCEIIITITLVSTHVIWLIPTNRP